MEHESVNPAVVTSNITQLAEILPEASLPQTHTIDPVPLDGGKEQTALLQSTDPSLVELVSSLIKNTDTTKIRMSVTESGDTFNSNVANVPLDQSIMTACPSIFSNKKKDAFVLAAPAPQKAVPTYYAPPSGTQQYIQPQYVTGATGTLTSSSNTPTSGGPPSTPMVGVASIGGAGTTSVPTSSNNYYVTSSSTPSTGAVSTPTAPQYSNGTAATSTIPRNGYPTAGYQHPQTPSTGAAVQYTSCTIPGCRSCPPYNTQPQYGQHATSYGYSSYSQVSTGPAQRVPHQQTQSVQQQTGTTTPQQALSTAAASHPDPQTHTTLQNQPPQQAPKQQQPNKQQHPKQQTQQTPGEQQHQAVETATPNGASPTTATLDTLSNVVDSSLTQTKSIDLTQTAVSTPPPVAMDTTDDEPATSVPPPTTISSPASSDGPSSAIKQEESASIAADKRSKEATPMDVSSSSTPAVTSSIVKVKDEESALPQNNPNQSPSPTAEASDGQSLGPDEQKSGQKKLPRRERKAGRAGRRRR
eukprot:TRINITY_DN5415_c0_g1_i1.p1 TRINITY_DN5415_c0_g1~~TRINITY_DN5415_c0_g1_i1.p1  ORF type:complete len:527 (+),score=68.62 TRINITY_DN5415_c0_g1_i1:227-1807(+)